MAWFKAASAIPGWQPALLELLCESVFAVIPAVEKEIKIRVVSVIDYKTKARPIGHVGRAELSLRDQLEVSDPIPVSLIIFLAEVIIHF